MTVLGNTLPSSSSSTPHLRHTLSPSKCSHAPMYFEIVYFVSDSFPLFSSGHNWFLFVLFQGCWKAFESKSQLSRHMQDKHAVYLFRCPKCNKQFSRASNLKTHMCTFHKIVHFYVCSVPGRITCPNMTLWPVVNVLVSLFRMSSPLSNRAWSERAPEAACDERHVLCLSRVSVQLQNQIQWQKCHENPSADGPSGPLRFSKNITLLLQTVTFYVCLDGFGVEDLDRLLQNLTMHHLVNGKLIPIQSWDLIGSLHVHPNIESLSPVFPCLFLQTLLICCTYQVDQCEL